MRPEKYACWLVHEASANDQKPLTVAGQMV